MALRLEIGNADREICLWPMAVRAPMAHSKNLGGVLIEDHKTSYHLNPSVGNTLGGGFHCTTFDCMAQRSSMKDYVPEEEEIVSILSLFLLLHGMSDEFPF